MMQGHTIRRTVAQVGSSRIFCAALSCPCSRRRHSRSLQLRRQRNRRELRQPAPHCSAEDRGPAAPQPEASAGRAVRRRYRQDVRLGDYFGKHPAILTLVYYNCPMLCSEEMDGLAGALEMVKMNPGKDFESSSSASIRPRRPRSRRRRSFYVKRYGRPRRERLALPHRPAACHRCSLQRHRLWLYSYPRAGWQA